MLRNGPCMLTLVLCALAHGSKTWAGDAAALADPSPAAKASGPNMPAPALPSIEVNPFAPRAIFDASNLSERPAEGDFSATEFRPRRRSPSTAGRTDYGSGDPMFRTTTVWQRLNEFRAQDRVRLLTLWEVGGSSVSLQAGKKGDPSLQWSSSWTNRSKVSHGLLDRLMAASLGGMANRATASRYSPASASPSKALIAAQTPATK